MMDHGKSFVTTNLWPIFDQNDKITSCYSTKASRLIVTLNKKQGLCLRPNCINWASIYACPTINTNSWNNIIVIVKIIGFRDNSCYWTRSLTGSTADAIRCYNIWHIYPFLLIIIDINYFFVIFGIGSFVSLITKPFPLFFSGPERRLFDTKQIYPSSKRCFKNS